MGKKMIRASIWTCRSLLSLYSKAVAFIFAVFCVVSGMSAGTVPTKESKSGKTISGVALYNSDLTPVKNVKIFMGNIACPVYGVGLCCGFNAYDSTVTDSMGVFETTYSEKLFGNGSGKVIFAKIDSMTRTASVSGDYYLNSNSDTTITLYLAPLLCTNVLAENSASSNPLLKTIHGNAVSIKIGDWSPQKKYTAEIINAAGKLIASPLFSSDGVLEWDTKESARGVYFLKIKTNGSTLRTQILLND